MYLFCGFKSRDDNVLEKLHRERWSPEDGVGSIIISPTRELAGQLFDVLKTVVKYHTFSAGLLIGGRKEVDVEKERVNELNILICTPGRLLQHMDKTPNFDCSQLQLLIWVVVSASEQVLVLDEADRILDIGFKKTVHEKAVSATPNRLQQTAMIVPLEKKVGHAVEFQKGTSQIRDSGSFVFEAFRKLRPGIPLKCLHGRMNQEKDWVYSQFCESRSVLFSTDVASRGIDFNKAVDWFVQVDCPEDVASYTHRVGRTACYLSRGRSVLFLMPSEMKMLEKLQAAKVPIQFIKANTKRLEPVSRLLSALLVKYSNMQHLAQRAFITYLRSIYIQKDKEIFDVMKLPIDDYSAALGLPMTPQSQEELLVEDVKDNKVDKDFLQKDTPDLGEGNASEIGDIMVTWLGGNLLRFFLSAFTSGMSRQTRVLKKKKLKINVHRLVGTRVVFDEEGNTQDPLAIQKEEYYKKMREELKQVDMEDKLLERQRLREKRIKKKMELKKGQRDDEDEDGDDISGSEGEPEANDKRKRSKIYFHSDIDGEMEENKDSAGINADSISLAEQELDLKLFYSMHS
ncbi:DEA(D/H)-box RNA helicase family protein isoform 2 [Hibiscus syriacus]|uniref:ATP-dependent RNA helicase n=1 Tax=Hibiscus syriacus TaxID=106335 RepID=A0A6A2XHE2_HIBSY|nr:DEA(D/H)-box RNA helicase family protein isoform 2 [Hibiscus syriacus]